MLRQTCYALGPLLAASVAAVAADLPNRLPPPLPPPVAIFTWTGFYLGPNVGYAFGSDDRIGFHRNPGNRSLGTPGTLHQSGVFGGGQAGYNYQLFGSVVIGAEADFQGASIDDQKTFVGFAPLQRRTATASTKIDSFGTVRGRIGYAFDRFLVYGTGGLAYAHVQSRETIEANGASPINGTIQDNKTRIGFAAGGGVEYAFTNAWSMKVEYQYIGLGRETISGPFIRQRNGNPTGSTVSTELTPSFQTVKIGANYRF